ncbi:MAG: tRNA glutamyl-Q(34) synthetase GluQRS [Oscillospiraceae bacterium]|nr:tRNA glutamyl-Q(34) synthetase GluQRS [Oscillospiraceae bacterium]
MPEAPVRGRFAPSPSGRMHLGNVFSALLAWLSVRSRDGTMLLRIEDLDRERCRPEYAAQIKRDLKTLGLDWDEEQPRQSTRDEAYLEQFRTLGALVYPCYCSRSELLAASAPHAADGRAVYPGTCRDLTPEQRAQKEKAPSWRVRVPDRVIAVDDLLQGRYEENLEKACGDFIVRRADGVYAYQLAVVTDDAAGGVTEVTRGVDLLSSAPRQRYLQELLGFPQVTYCHVPLLTDASGRRLSKRDGDLDLGALLDRMTVPELLGHLAFAAGLLEKYEPATARELIPVFRLDRLKRENIKVRDYFPL